MYEDYRRKELIDEHMGLMGMIAEIKAKCRLCKSKIQEMDVESSVEQMRNDLATYSRRLDEIYEELKSYVVISDVP